ncbi:MAG TPA: trypsin-like peptidase domain-containing protein [Caulobacteraceae bacterium]|nr:trypsin-like peptidase domain-containing protein [Caulobacteraceae bacterium]
MALGLWLAPAVALANVFAADGEDPRQFAGSAEVEAVYAPIGRTTTDGPVRVYTGDGPHALARVTVSGTGFMISPCLMVTNFHTVFGDVDTSPDRAGAHFVTFEVGAGTWKRFRYKARAEVLAWGDLGAGEDGDWALARVEGCPGGDASVGWFATDALGAIPRGGVEVSMAGFAADRALDRLSIQHTCRIHAGRALELIHDCASTGGDSGAPLLIQRSGRWAVVGLTSGADEDERGVLRHFDPEHGNWAVRVEAILADPRAKALIDSELTRQQASN